MESKGIFKTSIVGGFEKESVLAYLEELSSSNAKLLEEKENEIESLLEQKSQKETEADSLLLQINELKLSLDNEIEEKKSMIMDISRLKSEVEKIRQQARKFENENILLAEKYKQLQHKHEDLSQREHDFNDTSVKLGSLLLEAQKTAETIVKNANTKSDEIKKDTKREIRDTISKLEIFKDDFESMKSDIQGILAVMGNKINEIDVSIESTLKKSKKITLDGNHNKKHSEKQNLEYKKTVRV